MFAFFVLRMVAPISRAQLLRVVQRVSPAVAGIDDVLASVPEDLDDPMWLVTLPWAVPDDDGDRAAQRELVETTPGVDAAWFFQTSDELPQATEARFPLDGYPEIIEDLDWEDFGVAFKLAGPSRAGEAQVLNAFHTLWLAPYASRFRNSGVTHDDERHAAHLWVDRFEAETGNDEQVHHLMWVLAQLDAVLPIAHARFAGATMAQKYSGMMDDAPEPFVLGGNPLVAAYREVGTRRWTV